MKSAQKLPIRFTRKAFLLPSLILFWMFTLVLVIEVTPENTGVESGPEATEETSALNEGEGEIQDTLGEEEEFTTAEVVFDIILDKAILFYLTYSGVGNKLITVMEFLYLIDLMDSDEIPTEEGIRLAALGVAVLCLSYLWIGVVLRRRNSFENHPGITRRPFACRGFPES